MTDQGEFAFRWRVIEPWHAPDDFYLFGRHGNFLTSAEMEKPSPETLLGRYIAQVRAWGFNGMLVWGDPDRLPRAFGNLARYLKSQGLGLFVWREWNGLKRGVTWPFFIDEFSGEYSEDYCPYHPRVRAYWQARVEKDLQIMPDFAGYRVSAGEFYYSHGAPWMCDCPECRQRTPRQRVIDAIGLVAGLLSEHGKFLFWETCDDDPHGQRHEALYFDDLTGALPENVLILMKDYYWDYRNDYPLHPLYGRISLDAGGRSPYATSLQQPGEYRGVHDFPWCMVNEWQPVFQGMAATGQQGLWVMALVHPQGWDHPLNLVNWQALSVYMRDPQADPAEIKRAWAAEVFGEGPAPTVVSLLARVTRAARGVFLFDALWTANHSRFPTLEYLDSHLCGPYRQTQRMAGVMGMGWPLDMYPPAQAAQIRADPRSRLCFNRLMITPQLKAELLSQKDDAVRQMSAAIHDWQGLEKQVDPQSYATILAGLKANYDDALIFRAALELYMDWKLGTLTEAQIDAALADCRGLHGATVPAPLEAHPPRPSNTVAPASLKTFAEQLRQDLRQPWITRYFAEHRSGVV